MVLHSLVWVGLLALSARLDEAPRVAESPVRTLLDTLKVAKDRAVAEAQEHNARVMAEHLPAAESEAKYEEAEVRYRSRMTPGFDALLDAATSYPNDPSAVEALGFVALSGRALKTDESRRAMVALRRDHVRAPNISSVTGPLFVHQDKPEATALLRAVIAENPSRIERGRACNDLAFLLHYRAGRASRFGRDHPGDPLPADLAGADPVALDAEVEALYGRCVGEFADVATIGFNEGKTVGDFARGALNEMRRLQVGSMAPEIVGIDIDGKPLRLSDHRGKVVVLVFSGEWCGPCRANAKFFRALLAPEAQKTAACVVLEVNTDTSPEPVLQAIKAGEITWPCWLDGGPTGPITMAWGVALFPTIHVLDPSGVIRAKDIRGEAVAAAVTQVVRDHPTVTKP